MCSVETYSSLRSRISDSASRRTRTSSLDGPADSPPCRTVGSASSAAFASERTAARLPPSLLMTGATTPSSCSSSTESRCSGVTCGLRRRSAREPAAAIASWDLIVKRSGCIRNLSLVDVDHSEDTARYKHHPGGYAGPMAKWQPALGGAFLFVFGPTVILTGNPIYIIAAVMIAALVVGWSLINR